jgi:NlpC/P60 family putative phage cell wall peptidase
MKEPAATLRRSEAKPAFTRADLIAEARSWIGTPWRHQAAIKGVGADCVGFVRGAAEPFVGKVPLATDYTTTWQLYRAEPRMYREFAARCEEVALDQFKPGDILLFGFGKGPAHHCGYAAPEGHIIHCYREAGSVVEQDLTDWWRRKLRHAFRVPGIADG